MDRSPSATPRAALRRLRRDLVRRRLARIDLRLRLEIALLALLVAGFVFWQARVVLASVAHARGPWAAAAAAATLWAGFAAAGGAIAFGTHLGHWSGRVPGPPWLSLPLAAGELRRHLAWEARLHAAWVAPAAPAILAAAAGPAPAAALPLLAGLFLLLHHAAAAAGTTLAFHVAPRGDAAAADPVARRLAARARAAPRHGRAGRPRWRRASRWRALWAKDLLLARRPTAARRRLLVALGLAALSVACWFLPASPGAARVLAFGLALLAAATYGEWLIALSGEDPLPVLRGLPVGIGALWLSRLAWAAGFALLLAAAHALAARALPPAARELFVAWVGGASLLVGVLAAHHGLTLYPRAEVAQRMYALALGIAIAASLMIPLLGWVVLLAAVIHSGLRLGRWSRIDGTAA